MRIVTARQAILNRKNQVVAYELLYRDGETNSFPDIDPHQATGKLLLNTHLNQGIPKLTDGKKAFINFTANCIKKRFPLMLPKDQIIVELVETIDPTDDEIFNAVRELFHAGYKIALDDFL
jgi:EAL and modified HD-GYP domain-containing signal transduction protein